MITTNFLHSFAIKEHNLHVVQMQDCEAFLVTISVHVTEKYI